MYAEKADKELYQPLRFGKSNRQLLPCLVLAQNGQRVAPPFYQRQKAKSYKKKWQQQYKSIHAVSPPNFTCNQYIITA